MARMTPYILILVFFSQTTSQNAAMTSVAQQFDSQATCEAAKGAAIASVTGPNVRIVSQGCYKK